MAGSEDRKALIDQRNKLAGIDAEPIESVMCGPGGGPCIGPACGMFVHDEEQCGIRVIGIAASFFMNAGPQMMEGLENGIEQVPENPPDATTDPSGSVPGSGSGEADVATVGEGGEPPPGKVE